MSVWRSLTQKCRLCWPPRLKLEGCSIPWWFLAGTGANGTECDTGAVRTDGSAMAASLATWWRRRRPSLQSSDTDMVVTGPKWVRGLPWKEGSVEEGASDKKKKKHQRLFLMVSISKERIRFILNFRCLFVRIFWLVTILKVTRPLIAPLFQPSNWLHWPFNG